MIATIRGKILQKNPPQVVIECGGLGYEIDVPMSTFYNSSEHRRRSVSGNRHDRS